MLKEISRENLQGRNRRWFSDDFFDLIVWLGRDTSISGFQLCYDIGRAERALTWTADGGYRHERIDDGEENPAKNRSPVLLPDGAFPAEEIITRFLAASAGLDEPIKKFVADKLRTYTTGRPWR